MRGFRQFFTIQVGDHQVSVRAGAASVTATTDRGGYVEVLLHDHGLEPGWQEVTITAAGAEPAQADVFIMEPGTDFGIVSDIDDTVIVTMLPRAMIAAYNSWFLRTDKRKAVPRVQRVLCRGTAAPPQCLGVLSLHRCAEYLWHAPSIPQAQRFAPAAPHRLVAPLKRASSARGRSISRCSFVISLLTSPSFVGC